VVQVIVRQEHAEIAGIAAAIEPLDARQYALAQSFVHGRDFRLPGEAIGLAVPIRRRQSHVDDDALIAGPKLDAGPTRSLWRLYGL